MPPRWRYVFGEALVGLRRNLMMTIAVVLSVMVSLTLGGLAFLLWQQVNLATDDWMGQVEASIFLCHERLPDCTADITPEQQQQLLTDLEAHPNVEEVFYESQEDAYARFQEMFRDDPDVAGSVEPDSLPASFRVALVDPAQIEVIAEEFQAYPGVDEVVDQSETLRDVIRVFDVGQWAAMAIALVQLIAAIVLITNTIRMAAVARRDQISIMKLVGASNWYVRLPFVLEGVLAGVIGALLGWGVLVGGVAYAAPRLRELIAFLPVIGMDHALLVGPLMLVVAVVVAVLASLVALWRFLDV